MTYFLTLEDVTELGIAMMAGEGEDFLIADPGLLDSALARPRASAFGEPAYPTLSAQAAALMHSLARNHALVDGKKRMAWAATKLFLRFNGIACVHHRSMMANGSSSTWLPARSRCPPSLNSW